MKHTGLIQLCAAVCVSASFMASPLAAQAPAAAPHQSGTVKAATGAGLTLTNAAGQDYSVALPATAKVLVVAPGQSPTQATAGTAADVTVGDKAIVIGTASDTGTTLTATKVYLMKSAAIAQSHAVEDAAWAQGGGGIVKSVDAAAGTLVVASGLKTVTVTVTPKTIVRHYSGDSVRFSDAQITTLAAIRPGDQLRVRGTKSADGLTLAADEMVAGTFHNYSGLIASIDPTAGTVTLKDLASKKTVTVTVTSSSDIRRLPPQVAQRVAMGMKGTAGAPSGAPSPAATAAPDAAAARPAAAAGAGRPGRAGADLSQMISRMPTETLGGLKVGDAVMIVATSASADSPKSTAVTLLAGVDAILTASPTGETTISPWSIGGGGGEGGEPGGGGAGGPGGGGGH